MVSIYKDRPQREKGARILLAEDNPINQKVALKILEKLGLVAAVVGNGKEAVEVLQKDEFNLVLMDCQMPEMDGCEATRTIRKSLKSSCDPNIPIIALTANAMKGDKEKCLEAGMDAFVSKPIDPRILAEVISRWLPIVSEGTPL